MSGLSPEEEDRSRRQLAMYGEEAAQIVADLVEACKVGDHHEGGRLCRKIYNNPNLLLLVIGMLTTTIVRLADGQPVRPQDLGVPGEDSEVEPWEVGALDQMQAAASQQDVDTFAQIALDTQIRAYLVDISRGDGELPDVQTLLRGFLMMDRTAVVTLAAESLRRLLKQEMERG